MKRLTAIFCLLWCLLLVRFAFAQWDNAGQGQAVLSVFERLGMTKTGAHLELTGELGRLSTEQKALEKLQKAAGTLEFGTEYEIIEEQKANGTVWTAQKMVYPTGTEQGFWTTIKVLAVEDGFFVRYYLQIEVDGAVDFEDISMMREKLEQIRKNERLDSMTGIRLQGSFDCVLTDIQKEQVCEYFLTETEAEMVSRLSEDTLWMVYAWSKELGDAILMGEEKVNLNLILRDSGTQTHLFVGIPAVWSDDIAQLTEQER